MLLSFALVGIAWASAVKARPSLRIGVVDDQVPCSEVVEDIYRGSAVDVWQEVASKANVQYLFKAVPSTDAGIQEAMRGNLDLLVSCLSITPSRLQKVEFSTPYTEDRLALLTRRKETSFLDIVRRLSSNLVIRQTTALLLLGGLLFAVILWLLSKEFQHRDIVGGNKRQTFFKGWMMLAMGTGIYKMGTAPPSMAVIALSNFIRLVITAIFVAATTSLVINASEEPSDLTESDILKRALVSKVGVDKGSFAAAWIDRKADAFLSDHNQRDMIVRVDSSDDMLVQLEQGKINSFLAERNRVMALQNKLKNSKDFEIVAQTFFRTPQAFVFGAKLDRKSQDAINVAISELKFDGEVESVLERWKTP
ncbi:transporter substrate-binding domain-containing protein [Synechococcus sp. ATX 2A4]|uniref:substrate-binding periplasmic protein n=1 Tax=Synechococcus sp. ATX 2A4 TaxID=2823727 RepID=UPI0020CC7CC6|nr:transporter substrate-binding domain-containing protein [Synechococcus sp. ATX 2A4]MCP9883799.1 transporter substrate-binding domain-containing protein [Synechococcus sp. ATX 2A4]